MAAMGRGRKNNKHLPQRVYVRSGMHYFVDLAGKWHMLARDYAEALQALSVLLGRQDTTNTIESLIERYTREELSTKAEKTRRERLQQFKSIHMAFGSAPPEAIEPHHVWGFWEARGRTEQARHEIRAFSALLTYARRVGARKSPNPCFGLQLPGARPRSRYVTDDEFLAMRDIAQPMVGYAMDLALLAGMDQATIRKLERRNITDAGILFERGKTGVEQLIEWNVELRLTVDGILREQPQLRRALICNRKGRPYNANGFQSQWQRLMKKAKKARIALFHFHDLRAKSASDSESDQVAADRLGHGDPALTRRVYRRLPRRATALRVLEGFPISKPDGK